MRAGTDRLMIRFRLIEQPSSTYDRETQPVQWEADRCDYISLIREIVRQPLDRQRGASLDEMRQGIRILDALEGKQIGDVLELEDADHAHLCEKIRAFPYGTVDRRLLHFAQTVLNATQDSLD